MMQWRLNIYNNQNDLWVASIALPGRPRFIPDDSDLLGEWPVEAADYDAVGITLPRKERPPVSFTVECVPVTGSDLLA